MFLFQTSIFIIIVFLIYQLLYLLTFIRHLSWWESFWKFGTQLFLFSWRWGYYFGQELYFLFIKCYVWLFFMSEFQTELIKCVDTPDRQLKQLKSTVLTLSSHSNSSEDCLSLGTWWVKLHLFSHQKFGSQLFCLKVCFTQSL